MEPTAALTLFGQKVRLPFLLETLMTCIEIIPDEAGAGAATAGLGLGRVMAIDELAIIDELDMAGDDPEP